MKLPLIKAASESTQFIPLQGGLDESTAFELKRSGTLINALNYESEVGAYPGYVSIKGYEAFDGQPAPSSIAVPHFVDRGIDKFTKVLLDESLGLADQSMYLTEITNADVAVVSTTSPKTLMSYRFEESSSLSWSALDWNQDFCINGEIRREPTVADTTLFEQSGVIKIVIEDSILKVYISEVGESYNKFASVGLLSLLIWFTFSISYYGGVLSVFKNGELIESEDVGTIESSSSDCILGSSSFVGNIAQFRVSLGTPRVVGDFIPVIPTYAASNYYFDTFDTVARETARDAITEITGDGDITGGFVFDGDTYVARYDDTAEYVGIFKETETGWVEIAQTEGEEIAGVGLLKGFPHRFDGYNGNASVCIITNGTDAPRVFDGDTLTIINDSNLPTTIFPHIAGVYDNRLFLGYDSSIFFSGVGDPTDFNALSNAGEILFGARITNIVLGPQNILVVTTASSTEILRSVAYNTDSGNWIFQVESFSSTIGGVENTAINFLGNVYWAAPVGVVSLLHLSEISGFELGTISRAIPNLYHNNFGDILQATIDSNKSKYYLYYTSGLVLVFSFNIDKTIRDVLPLNYGITLKQVFYDDTNTFFISEDSNYCYQLNAGTSFNGGAIPTSFRTNPTSLKSVGVLKKFRKAVFDVIATIGTSFFIKPFFYYGDSDKTSPVTSMEVSMNIVADAYGEAIYGSSRYGNILTESMPYYQLGVGTSLSISIHTLESNRDQHKFKSILVQFLPTKRRN